MSARDEVERGLISGRNVWMPLMFRLGRQLGLSREIVQLAIKQKNSLW